MEDGLWEKFHGVEGHYQAVCDETWILPDRFFHKKRLEITLLISILQTLKIDARNGTCSIREGQIKRFQSRKASYSPEMANDLHSCFTSMNDVRNELLSMLLSTVAGEIYNIIDKTKEIYISDITLAPIAYNPVNFVPQRKLIIYYYQ